GGDPVRNPGAGDLSFGAGDPPRDGRLMDQERAGDLGGGQAAHHPQGERDLRWPGQRRVAGGEDQPHALVPGGLDRPRQLRELDTVVGLAPHHVQSAAAGDGEQPRIRPLRDPFLRPVLERGQHRVLDQILRGGEVACHMHQRHGQLACVLPDHAGQLVVRGAGHGADDSSGRISTTGQPGHVLTMRSASSRSGTSISAYPLTTSLPSTNGPSMRTGSPRSSRTVVAVSGDRSLLPPRIFSAWVATHSAARSYARSRSAGPMASRSLEYCSVSTNNSTYFNLAPLRTSLGHPRGARAGALASTAPAPGLAVQLGHP